MQIVIDISDEEYEDVKKAGGCYYDFGKAILNGRPLPKIDNKEDVQKVIDSMNEEQQDVLYYLIGATVFMYDEAVIEKITDSFREEMTKED